MDNKDIIKTGTTTIGLVCKEGIIFIADKRATAGNFIADKKAEKVHQVADFIGVTIAGLVSDAQLLVKLIRAELQLKKLRTGKEHTVKEAANLIAGLTYGNIRRLSMLPGIVGFLVAGKDDEGYHLYNIGPDGSVSEEPEYTTDGSGSVFALGVLESDFRKGMSIDEGTKLAMKAMNAAVQRDSASGSGFDIVTITKDGYRKVLTKQLAVTVEA